MSRDSLIDSIQLLTKASSNQLLTTREDPSFPISEIEEEIERLSLGDENIKKYLKPLSNLTDEEKKYIDSDTNLKAKVDEFIAFLEARRNLIRQTYLDKFELFTVVDAQNSTYYPQTLAQSCETACFKMMLSNLDLGESPLRQLLNISDSEFLELAKNLNLTTVSPVYGVIVDTDKFYVLLSSAISNARILESILSTPQVLMNIINQLKEKGYQFKLKLNIASNVTRASHAVVLKSITATHVVVMDPNIITSSVGGPSREIAKVDFLKLWSATDFSFTILIWPPIVVTD